MAKGKKAKNATRAKNGKGQKGKKWQRAQTAEGRKRQKTTKGKKGKNGQKQKRAKGKKAKTSKNKAVYTTASVAYGWAGAVTEVKAPFGVFSASDFLSKRITCINLTKNSKFDHCFF